MSKESMASLSHSSSLSQSNLPMSHSSAVSGSATATRHHASIDIVPWVVYDHTANEAESLTDGQGTIRVVGRGRSEPWLYRRRTVSATARIAVPAVTSRTRKASSECPLSDCKSVRVVGRGGYGSKPRILDSRASKDSALNPASTTATPVPENRDFRIGGRGGAGSRPRAFKPKKTKEKRCSWFEKGKAKLRISRPMPPAAVSESEDDSSIEFAPIPQPPSKLSTLLTPVNPSVTLDDYPDTPTATFASSSNHSFQTQTPRRLNKLYRTLGQSFPQDMTFMSIKAPVLKSVSDGNPVPTQNHSLSQSLRSTRTFPYDSFPIEATGSQHSSFVEAAYIDDKFEAASFASGTSSRRLSPISFFEPQITQSEREIPDGEGQSSTLFLSYHYPEEPPDGAERDTPFSQYYKPSSDLQSVDCLEVDPAQTWSGGWNADMKHVLTSLRELH